jgi:hypothetical protein
MHTFSHAVKQYIAIIRACQLWFHGAHLASRGAGFVGDHAELLSEIYTAHTGHLDATIEKAIGITNDESFSSPIETTAMALKVLTSFPQPHQATALATMSFGLKLEQLYIEFLNELFKTLEDRGELSLGFNDFIMADANNHESFVYKLQQRAKTELEN